MSANSVLEIRIGDPEGVVQVKVGGVAVDIPRSVGYFGGVALAVGIGVIEPPLALFIAAVPLFKMLANSALPFAARVVGEILEGAAKPVGSDAEGVVHIEDQHIAVPRVIRVPVRAAPWRRT